MACPMCGTHETLRPLRRPPLSVHPAPSQVTPRSRSLSSKTDPSFIPKRGPSVSAKTSAADVSGPNSCRGDAVCVSLIDCNALPGPDCASYSWSARKSQCLTSARALSFNGDCPITNWRPAFSGTGAGPSGETGTPFLICCGPGSGFDSRRLGRNGQWSCSGRRKGTRANRARSWILRRKSCCACNRWRLSGSDSCCVPTCGVGSRRCYIRRAVALEASLSRLALHCPD